jgi:cytochrome b561
MRWRDTKAGYGLTSILAHWVSAAIVVSMLLIGNAIVVANRGQDADMLNLHTSVGIAAAPILIFRIYWRLKHKHPGALPRQSSGLVRIATAVHYMLVMLIALMLVTGPLVAWYGHIPVEFLNWFALPSPVEVDATKAQLAHQLHLFGATSILILVLAHVAGTFFHVIFRKDGTLDKMLVPGADLAEE